MSDALSRASKRISRRGALLMGSVVAGLAVALPPELAQAADRPVIDVQDHGGDPSGVRDSGPAIRSAIAALRGKPGIVHFHPGTYRVRATARALYIELTNGVELRGTGIAPTILLESDDHSAYREFVRVTGSDVTINHLRIRRSGTFPCVLINAPQGDRFTILRSTVDGGVTSAAGNYCHGLQLGLWNKKQSDITIDHCTFTRLTYCILTTNECTAVLRRIRVVRSAMQSIDLNFPKADTREVLIAGNLIDGTGSQSFGVSLANVHQAAIRDNTIQNVPNEAIHIEDHSDRVIIERNTFVNNASTGTDAFAVVQVISGSSRIVVRHNVFQGRRRPGKSTFFVAAQPGGTGRTVGGRAVASPTTVRVHHNTFSAGRDTAIDGIYLEGVAMARVQYNTIIGAGTGAGPAYVGPPRAGVLVRGGKDLLIAGNRIRGWRVALNAVGASTGSFRENAISKCGALRTTASTTLRVAANAVS